MINNNTCGISTMHGKAIISPVGPNSLVEPGSGPISFKTTYINNLSVDVTVIERNGLRQRIPSNYNCYNKNFVIHTEIYVRRDGYKDIEKIISCDDNELSKDLRTIKEAYHIHRENKKFNGMNIQIDSVITNENIIDNNGNIYYANKDVVVSTLSLTEAPAHPYGESSISNKLFDGLDDSSGVGIHIEIIDNKQLIGNRYINIANQTYTIVPKNDSTRRDGIYVTNLDKNITTKIGKKLSQKYFEFSDSETVLGIYKTREEALTCGDIKLARKEELMEREHDLKLEIQELTRLRSIADRDNQDYKNTIERRTLELNNSFTLSKLELERENLVLNQKRDAELAEQKSEMAKFKHDSEMREHKAKLDEIERSRSIQREKDDLDIRNKYLENEISRNQMTMKNIGDGLKLMALIITTFGTIALAVSKLSKT